MTFPGVDGAKSQGNSFGSTGKGFWGDRLNAQEWFLGWNQRSISCGISSIQKYL